jgi:LPS-assembly protein
MLFGAAQSVPLGPSTFNQFVLNALYGHRNKRGLTVATNVGFDAEEGLLQYTNVEASYNWDCCGLTFEYRRFAVGTITNDHEYRFSFSLANVGSFGTLTKQERLY